LEATGKVAHRPEPETRPPQRRQEFRHPRVEGHPPEDLFPPRVDDILNAGASLLFRPAQILRHEADRLPMEILNGPAPANRLARGAEGEKKARMGQDYGK
jgi:hypothetical protein